MDDCGEHLACSDRAYGAKGLAIPLLPPRAILWPCIGDYVEEDKWMPNIGDAQRSLQRRPTLLFHPVASKCLSQWESSAGVGVPVT